MVMKAMTVTYLTLLLVVWLISIARANPGDTCQPFGVGDDTNTCTLPVLEESCAGKKCCDHKLTLPICYDFGRAEIGGPTVVSACPSNPKQFVIEPGDCKPVIACGVGPSKVSDFANVECADVKAEHKSCQIKKDSVSEKSACTEYPPSVEDPKLKFKDCVEPIRNCYQKSRVSDTKVVKEYWHYCCNAKLAEQTQKRIAKLAKVPAGLQAIEIKRGEYRVGYPCNSDPMKSKLSGLKVKACGKYCYCNKKDQTCARAGSPAGTSCELNKAPGVGSANVDEYSDTLTLTLMTEEKEMGAENLVNVGFEAGFKAAMRLRRRRHPRRGGGGRREH